MTRKLKADTAKITVEQTGPIATMILRHDLRRNVLTRTMWQQFAPLTADLEADESVKVIVVRGAGADFSAGADISDLHAILRDKKSGMLDGGYVSAAETALASCGKPTIAAIDGYCLGGAWQIAGACDVRIASDRATFGITPSRIGVVYPLSGIERLVELVGPATAKYLLFTGDFVNARTAQQLGMVVQVLPYQDFWSGVYQFAERLSRRSQFSVHAMKDLIDVIAERRPDLAGRNRFWQEQMTASADAKIGIEAFLAKESPAFTWTRSPRTVDPQEPKSADSEQALPHLADENSTNVHK